MRSPQSRRDDFVAPGQLPFPWTHVLNGPVRPRWCRDRHGHPLGDEIDEANLAHLLRQAQPPAPSDFYPDPNTWLLVHFTRPDCPFRRRWQPLFQRLVADAYPHLCAVSVPVTVGDNAAVAMRHGVRSVPALVLFRGRSGSHTEARWHARYRGQYRMPALWEWVERETGLMPAVDSAGMSVCLRGLRGLGRCPHLPMISVASGASTEQMTLVWNPWLLPLAVWLWWLSALYLLGMRAAHSAVVRRACARLTSSSVCRRWSWMRSMRRWASE